MCSKISMPCESTGLMDWYILIRPTAAMAVGLEALLMRVDDCMYVYHYSLKTHWMMQLIVRAEAVLLCHMRCLTQPARACRIHVQLFESMQKHP